MNSKLLKKKSTLIFSAVFAILIVSCVFLNAFLVKPAVAKSGNNVDSSATDEVTTVKILALSFLKKQSENLLNFLIQKMTRIFQSV